MKKRIPAPIAISIVVVALGLVALALSQWAEVPPSSGDVRPMIAQMNTGKPETETIPPEVVLRDVASKPGRKK